MPFLRVLALSALSATCALFAQGAAADTGATEMQQAVADFTAAEQALATSPPCETMCKALQSMSRAAERICELAKDGGPIDQKRCVDAKAKVEEATARVRAACPDCLTGKPEAPVTAHPPMVAEKPPAPAPAPGKEASADTSEVMAVSATGRGSTLAIDLLPLLLPPAVVQLRLVRRVGRRTAFAVTFGVGSVEKSDATSNMRTTGMLVGGELRVTVAGTFDGMSAFVGADFAYREAGLDMGEHIKTRGFPLGFVLGPELGTRLVTASGLTIEARAGFDYLAQDTRGPGAPKDKILPLGAISLGWSF